MKAYVIGLDLGTTSAKSIIFDRKGNVVAEHEVGYPLHHPEVGYAEQDPLVIESAALDAIKGSLASSTVSNEEIAAVGISTAMHSLICMDEAGKPLSPSIIWADARSAKEAAALKKNRSDIYLRTGTPLHPMSPLSKLVWMDNHDYEPAEKADFFVSIKEFLIYRWFNEKVVDFSIAAATGLFDIHSHEWDEEALKLASIEQTQLFTPVPPTYRLDGLSREKALESGLLPETPFIIGASDGPLANLGIGAIQPGETAITIGTSGAIRQFSSEPLLNDSQEIFSYSFTEDLWITGGPSNNGGLVLTWLQQLWQNGSHEMDIEKLSELADKVAPGANNLLFLPYLNGERAPFWNAEAKGSFIGLTPTHKKEHMTRAAMEGVHFSILHIAKALERLGNQHTKIFASGGFARSSLWVQMLADIFNQTIHIPQSHQSSAWGAAWLALYGIGEVDSLEDIKNSIPMDNYYQPIKDNHTKYRALFPIYETASGQMQDVFSKLHQLD
ncbi:gluconokinase [Halobacillus salinarum]|uniref:Gluconokinase n=1 Tax=Halobacillus salinarum TaxID=2932257 RepID=A0ABY4EMH8_9BACI|nr:gluconokinase [Halobacillus salinarum]UOQ45063.1 gluconokinase [Halobacillus salinarum]